MINLIPEDALDFMAHMKTGESAHTDEECWCFPIEMSIRHSSQIIHRPYETVERIRIDGQDYITGYLTFHRSPVEKT